MKEDKFVEIVETFIYFIIILASFIFILIVIPFVFILHLFAFIAETIDKYLRNDIHKSKE